MQVYISCSNTNRIWQLFISLIIIIKGSDNMSSFWDDSAAHSLQLESTHKLHAGLLVVFSSGNKRSTSEENENDCVTYRDRYDPFFLC